VPARFRPVASYGATGLFLLARAGRPLRQS